MSTVSFARAADAAGLRPLGDASEATGQPRSPTRAPAPGRERTWLDTVSRVAGAPSSVATEIESLRDPLLAWERRLELVREARSSLVVTTYCVEPDARGLAFADALIEAALRGVRVVLLFDTVAQRVSGKLHPVENRRKLAARLILLSRIGASVGRYAPLGSQLARPGSGLHFKSLVADGARAIVGGRNVGHWYYELWSDNEVCLRGPIVADVARAALRLAARGKVRAEGPREVADKARMREEIGLEIEHRASRESVAFPAAAQASIAGAMQLVCWDPYRDAQKGQPNPITRALKETFDRAEHEIVASSNFVNGARELRESILSASLRGVRVLLATTGEPAAIVSTFPYHTATAHYPALLAAGVELYETPVMDHGKMYVVDGKVAALGSYNLGKPSHRMLAEGLVFTEEPNTVAQIRAALDETIAGAKRVDGATYRPARGFMARLGRLVGRWFDP